MGCVALDLGRNNAELGKIYDPWHVELVKSETAVEMHTLDATFGKMLLRMTNQGTPNSGKGWGRNTH